MQPEKLIAHQLAQHLKSADHGAMVMITQEYLKECLSYNPLSGHFHWRQTRPLSHFKNAGGSNIWHSLYAGKLAGTSDPLGYVRINMRGTPMLSHRLSWLYQYGSMPTGQIDHIDGDPSNNRFSNLRDVSHQENQKNQRRRCTNTSGTTGVTWHKGGRKWLSQIIVSGHNHYLGLYENIDDAITARKAAEVEHGFHVNHGRM